jgi:acetyltransferase-like isoleucine patch superfamily enzyme
MSANRKLDPPQVFDRETGGELREQILRYHMSELLTDVERARFFGLPATCRMREGAKILYPQNLKCGEYVWIGEGAILDASGGLEIGSHTSIGLNVFVWTHDSSSINAKMKNVPQSAEIIRKPTRIGSGCFIAGPSVILAGVTIGDRGLITPLSLVDRDVEEGEVFSSQRETKKALRAMRKEIEELRKMVEKLSGGTSGNQVQ